MNAELANLAKEIGRIAQSQQDSVECDKVAKLSEIVLIFDSPELESLNYHQFQNVVETYGIAHSQRDDVDWNAVQLFAKMMLQIDRAMVGHDELVEHREGLHDVTMIDSNHYIPVSIQVKGQTTIGSR